MDIEQKQIAALFSSGERIQYRKGDVLLQPGSDVSNVYLLEDGYVRLYGIVDEDREITFHIFKPGSYFPMFLVFGKEENTYFFEAMTSVSVRALSAAVVEDFLKKHPDVMQRFTQRVITGLSGLLANTQNFLFGSVHHRVLSVIHMLIRRFGVQQKTGEIFITIPLTHEDIAHMIGATREATSMELLRLSREHTAYHKQKHIIVPDKNQITNKLNSDDGIIAENRLI